MNEDFSQFLIYAQYTAYLACPEIHFAFRKTIIRTEQNKKSAKVECLPVRAAAIEPEGRIQNLPALIFVG